MFQPQEDGSIISSCEAQNVVEFLFVFLLFFLLRQHLQSCYGQGYSQTPERAGGGAAAHGGCSSSALRCTLTEQAEASFMVLVNTILQL